MEKTFGNIWCPQQKQACFVVKLSGCLLDEKREREKQAMFGGWTWMGLSSQAVMAAGCFWLLRRLRRFLTADADLATLKAMDRLPAKAFEDRVVVSCFHAH